MRFLSEDLIQEDEVVDEAVDEEVYEATNEATF